MAYVAAALTVVLVGAVLYLVRSGPPTTQVSAVFNSAVGVYVGSDVRVLGVRVGSIESVTPQGTTVKVGMSVDPEVRIAADSTAVAISPSLVSDRYIQLTAAKRGAATLRSGTTIALAKTATPVELDRIYASISDMTTALGPNGANKDGSLSKLLEVADRNLDGNGAELNSTINEFGKAAKTLDGSQEDLFGTISNLKSFNDTLARNDQGIAQVNDQLASVSGYLAADREDLAAAVTQLGEALAEVQVFIKDNRGAITDNVNGLQSTAETLKRQKASLEKITASLPIALQNFLDAYDPSTGTLNSRGNLNELGVWAGSGAGGAVAPSSVGPTATSPSSASPASAAPTTAGSGLPMFLPVVSAIGVQP